MVDIGLFCLWACSPSASQGCCALRVSIAGTHDLDGRNGNQCIPTSPTHTSPRHHATAAVGADACTDKNAFVMSELDPSQIPS